MPAYLDFMLIFGGQSETKDPRFSGFREQIRLKSPGTGHSAPDLGRSGKHYQICFNLKAVQLKRESKEDMTLHEWSIRDAAVYHRFDVDYGNALWIITKGDTDLRNRYEELTRSTGQPGHNMYTDTTSCFQSALVTHLLHCQWSTEDWRWYIVWLERVVQHEVSRFSSTHVHAEVKFYRASWQSTDPVPLAFLIDNT